MRSGHSYQANGATALGGGIYALASTVDLQNCTVSGNKANGTMLGEGGGIYTFNSVLSLLTTQVKGNKATTAFDDIFSGPCGNLPAGCSLIVDWAYSAGLCRSILWSRCITGSGRRIGLSYLA
jgi:hypothetical protein